MIILRCGTIGWPGVGLGGAAGACGAAACGGAAGVAGTLGWTGGGATVTAGGVTTTAGGAAGFSAGGGATTTAGGLAAGGATTTGFSAAGAAGFGATTAAGFSAAGTGGATGACGFTAAGAAGFAAIGRAGGAAGCSLCCSRSRSSLATSPGLCTLEKSILGLLSAAALSLAPEPDFAVKCLRTRSASSSSIELEWVFFSVTPTSGKISRIALAFTSSSLARSLIRIFIRFRFPPGFPATRS